MASAAIASNVFDNEGAPVNPIAEAVRGLARDRSALVKELREANRYWDGFSDFERVQLERIEKIDKRIDDLISKDGKHG